MSTDDTLRERLTAHFRATGVTAPAWYADLAFPIVHAEVEAAEKRAEAAEAQVRAARELAGEWAVMGHEYRRRSAASLRRALGDTGGQG